jgi:hypothetical protein
MEAPGEGRGCNSFAARLAIHIKMQQRLLHHDSFVAHGSVMWQVMLLYYMQQRLCHIAICVRALLQRGAAVYACHVQLCMHAMCNCLLPLTHRAGCALPEDCAEVQCEALTSRQWPGSTSTGQCGLLSGVSASVGTVKSQLLLLYATQCHFWQGTGAVHDRLITGPPHGSACGRPMSSTLLLHAPFELCPHTLQNLPACFMLCCVVLCDRRQPPKPLQSRRQLPSPSLQCPSQQPRGLAKPPSQQKHQRTHGRWTRRFCSLSALTDVPFGMPTNNLVADTCWLTSC